MVSNTPTVKQQLIVWWGLWVALQTSIFFFFYFLRSGTQRPANVNDLPWLIAAAPVLLSCVIRWILLPRLQNHHQALPAFVVGMALAESSTYLGLFLFPAHQEPLLALSALGIFQFVPVYARRFYATPAPDPLRS